MNQTNKQGPPRTRFDDIALREAISVLETVTEALEDVAAGTDSMAGACKERGLDYLKVRRFLTTKNFANCRLGKPLAALEEISKLGPDGCERLYLDIFELDDARDVKLPADFKETIRDVLGTLSEREQEVISLRYGLNDELPMTLRETGEVIGVQPERVRQIEAKALRKFRHPSRAKQLEKGSIWYNAEQEAIRAAIDAQRKAADAWLAGQKKKAQAEAGKHSQELADTQETDAGKISIDDMGLSVSTRNCLRRAGKTTFQDVLRMTDEDFLKVRSFGKKRQEEVRRKRDELLAQIVAENRTEAQTE